MENRNFHKQQQQQQQVLMIIFINFNKYEINRFTAEVITFQRKNY